MTPVEPVDVLYSQVDHHRHSPISAQHDQAVTPLTVRQSALGHENPTSKRILSISEMTVSKFIAN